MAKLLLSVLLASLASISVAQRKINGKVVDQSGKEVISYANIGIRNSPVGTLSNEDGSFSISISKEYAKDTLTFSALGYDDRSIPIASVLSQASITVELSEKLETLAAITVSAKKEKTKSVDQGNRYWKGGVNLCVDSGETDGASIALLIEPQGPMVHKGLSYPLYIGKARVRIQKNTLDNYKFRVRVYEVDSLTGEPGADLLNKNVIIRSGKKKGWLETDLSSSNISIDRPFFIAFEWIRDKQERAYIIKEYEAFRKQHPESVTIDTSIVDGEKITYRNYHNSFHLGTSVGVSAIPFSLQSYKCFYRENSLGAWKRAPYILTSRVTLSNQPSQIPGTAAMSEPGQEDHPEPKEKAHTQQAIKMCEDFLGDGNAHGVQLAVSKNGKLILSEGMGLADIEEGIPVTDNTRFRVGSISKALTSAALIKLVDEQKLDLDAPVQQYVPSFPRKKYDITTRQLAGHLAGIRHYDTSSEKEHYKDLVRTKHYSSSTETLDIFENDSLLFKPGSKYHYSSFGWSLVGAVIEGASGQPYLDYMQENIWKPLKMQHTCGDVIDSILTVRAEGYDAGSAKVETGDPSYNYPGRGLLSNARDLVLFGDQLLYGDYFNADLVKELFTSQKTADGKLTDYGLGWNIVKDKNGHTVYFQRGQLLDGSGFLALYPDDNLVIAFLANSPEAEELDVQELGSLFYNSNKSKY